MLATVSQKVVLVLGLAVLMLSAWGIFNPHNLLRLVRSVLDKKWGIYFGVAVRLVLGAALINAAANSLFPIVFLALGWIAILAALALIIMGEENIRKLVVWFAQLSTPVTRLWLLFGMAFGGFLVYGVL